MNILERVIITVSQVNKLRLKDVRQLACDATCDKLDSCDLSIQTSQVLKSMLLNVSLHLLVSPVCLKAKYLEDFLYAFIAVLCLCM